MATTIRKKYIKKILKHNHTKPGATLCLEIKGLTICKIN